MRIVKIPNIKERIVIVELASNEQVIWTFEQFVKAAKEKENKERDQVLRGIN